MSEPGRRTALRAVLALLAVGVGAFFSPNLLRSAYAQANSCYCEAWCYYGSCSCSGTSCACGCSWGEPWCSCTVNPPPEPAPPPCQDCGPYYPEHQI